MTEHPVPTPSLSEALASTGTPSPTESNDYRIAASVGAAFLARARSGAPSLLIPLAVPSKSVGRRGGGFSLTTATRVVFEYDGRRWEQPAATLECTEPALTDAFLVLVADLGRRLSSRSGEAAWPMILAWVEEWQMLLARRPLLTTEQQLGLWGELWVIARAKDADALIAAWRGPEFDAADFFLDGLALEVKVSRHAHTHHISQRQVESPSGTHLAYLLSVWIGVDPIRGVSLAELVDTILARTADPPELLKRLALLGYAPIDRSQYGTRFIPMEPPRWFRADDVPRVRMVDAGITQLRYLATLDVDLSLDNGLTKELWRHFCGD